MQSDFSQWNLHIDGQRGLGTQKGITIFLSISAFHKKIFISPINKLLKKREALLKKQEQKML